VHGRWLTRTRDGALATLQGTPGIWAVNPEGREA
jgi:hypothetical protein